MLKFLVVLAMIAGLCSPCYASVWRVEMDTSFTTEEDAVAFVNGVEQLKSKIYKPTGAEKIETHASCRYHECFHDENPPKQCGNYKYVDFKKSTPDVHLTQVEEAANK